MQSPHDLDRFHTDSRDQAARNQAAARDHRGRRAGALDLRGRPAAPASEPEIIRVWLPAEQTSKCFPPGTELRVMPADEFESLVVRATAGSSRQNAPEAPRLIRARHHARWSARRVDRADRAGYRSGRERAGRLRARRLVTGGRRGPRSTGRFLWRRASRKSVCRSGADIA